MCGIAGIIGRGDESAYDEMLGTMARRGPDQEGIWLGAGTALLHRRLSVVDLEHGRQPMTLNWAGETYIVVYNGELYNTDEVRSDLIALGHDFTSHSDTEVLLHAYASGRKRASTASMAFSPSASTKNGPGGCFWPGTASASSRFFMRAPARRSSFHRRSRPS